MSRARIEITIAMADTPNDVKKILGPNERVELYIKEKIYHPKLNVDSAVITNERIIMRHPHALGLKKDYTDFNYKDISNAVLEKGVLRSTIKGTFRLGGEPFVMGDLPNSEAEMAYGIIRQNSVTDLNPQPSAAPASVPSKDARPAKDTSGK
ncbi:MAG: PH domain-containing protein [Thaumarchaeota archaeon]|nr:PH domain-containing protein [Nitrososphaerota archaeon]